ncbi:MAG: hypothetical protein NTU47_05410 [Ignavibacteriales bacterium]|nr:hypothetical protein [Ignavibacteriales bacterium]
MKVRHVLLLLTLTSAGVYGQVAGKFEVAVGVGADIARFSPTYRNDHSFSASICYNLTNEWGVALYFGQQQYSPEGELQLDSKTPQFIKTSKSLLVEGRYLIPTKLMVLSPYVSVALGYVSSGSSQAGYYIVRNHPVDTVFHAAQTGGVFLGRLSPGIQIRPFSFLGLFAEMQVLIPSDVDLCPGRIAGRVGMGIIF